MSKVKESKESKVKNNVTTNNHSVSKKVKGIPKYPEHIVNLALLIKNNAEIRRYTALGIINYLSQKHIINGEHKFVKFMWDKFAVITDGLATEYKYTETFFLNCLVAAFSSFAASAQITINNFTHTEMSKNIQDIATTEEVQAITDSTFKNE